MDKRNNLILPHTDKIILIFILIIALGLRLYRLSTPLADLHSWRQADTAAVARNFEKHGFDLLHPRYDDVSSNQTGYENPEGYRMVEFPIYNAIFAGAHKALPIVSLEAWGRLISAIFSLFIIAAIYIISLHEDGRTTAFYAAATYAVFPFFIFFSRTVLPETTALSFALLSILSLYLTIKSTSKFKVIILYILSFIFFGLGLLAKPPVIFYTIALAGVFYKKYKKSVLLKLPFYLFFILGFAPLVAWRLYIRSYPEGIPASDWLITSVNTYEGMKNIFFKPAFFRWIFYERLTNIVLGGYLTFFLILGILKKQKNIWFISMLLSAGTYLFTFQGGNVQHEYYQTLILPAIAIAVGRGVAFVNENKSLFVNQFIMLTICATITLAALLFSWYRVQEFYRVPNDLVQIARVITSLTNKNDLIVTDRLGDTTLLYLSDRRGAPSKYKPLEELKNLGYSYYVTQNSEEIAQLKGQDYYRDRVVFENIRGDVFALFKL